MLVRQSLVLVTLGVLGLVLVMRYAPFGGGPGCSVVDAVESSDAVKLEARVAGSDEACAFDIFVVNDSSQQVIYGEGYRLEQLIGDRFEPLSPAVGPFAGPALELEAGETSPTQRIGPSVVRFGVPTPLAPGHYRIVSVIDAGQEISVEVTVG